MRNLTDSQTARLAERGGLQGMNTCSTFVANPDEKTVDGKDLADHADRIARLTGRGPSASVSISATRPGTFPSRPLQGIRLREGLPGSVAFTAELLPGLERTDVRGILGDKPARLLGRTIG